MIEFLEKTLLINPRWENFGRWLRQQRLALPERTSQDDCATAAEMSFKHWQRLENGSTGTKRETLPLILLAVGIGVTDSKYSDAYKIAGFMPPGYEEEEAIYDINDESKQAENAQRRVIADRIRYRREYLGYSQEEIATAVGLKRTTYGHYESGLNGVSSEILTKLARVLGCSADYLLGLDTETYDPDHTDLPPEFERIWGLHGKVMHAMPPGRARNAYMEQLRSMAEANLAILEDRLKREEEKTGEE